MQPLDGGRDVDVGVAEEAVVAVAAVAAVAVVVVVVVADEAAVALSFERSSACALRTRCRAVSFDLATTLA